MAFLKIDRNKIKSFVFSSSKIAFAILIVAVVLGVIGAGIFYLKERNEEQRKEKLAKKIVWPEDSAEPIGVTFHLATKYQDGNISYIFGFENYSDAIKKAENGPNAKFTLTFYDKDGFKLDEIEIYLNEMTKLVDKDGNPVARRIYGSEYMDVDTYEIIERWDARWSL